MPPVNEPNKTLAVVKIVGLTVLMVGAGTALYAVGARRKSKLSAAEVKISA